MTVKKCLFCNKEFVALQHNLNKGWGKYCSRKCADKSRIKKIEIICKQCRHIFIISPHEIKRIRKDTGEVFERKYCSVKCSNKSHYKGGFINKYGYKMISIDGKNKLEHRYIIEKHLGRTLKKTEHIHHINGNKLDNRIENLQIMTNSQHLKNEWKNVEKNGFKNSKKSWFKKGHYPGRWINK